MIHDRQQSSRPRKLRALVGVLSRMLLLGVLALLVIGAVAYVALHVKQNTMSDPTLSATATAAAQYPPGTREYFYWNQGQQQPAPEPPQP
jgi:hypothetical protein